MRIAITSTNRSPRVVQSARLPGTGTDAGPVLGVTATIGGRTATVRYAGGAQNLVAGVIQVNVEIPAGVTAGNAVPVVVQVGTNSSQPGVTLAVSN